MNSVFLLSLLFVVKHITIDYFLQNKYQYSNKGVYGHFGGLLHSGMHCIGTVLVLMVGTLKPLNIIVVLGILDFLTHYHIDYIKTNMVKTFQLNGKGVRYWTLTVVDQTLHLLTYIGIIYLIK